VRAVAANLRDLIAQGRQEDIEPLPSEVGQRREQVDGGDRHVTVCVDRDLADVEYGELRFRVPCQFDGKLERSVRRLAEVGWNETRGKASTPPKEGPRRVALAVGPGASESKRTPNGTASHASGRLSCSLCSG
jgi:hypothetical protein